jgi:recombination protein RecA
LPRGRSSRSSDRVSGKTTLVYHVIAEAARAADLRVHRRRARNGSELRKRIGVNIDDLLVSQPDTGEQALEITEL